MSEAAGLLRVGHLATLALLAGASLLALLSRDPEDGRFLAFAAKWSGLLAVALLVASLLARVATLPAPSDQPLLASSWTFLTETWSGRIGAIRVLATALAAAAAAGLGRGQAMAGVTLLLAATSLALVPAGGHAVSAEPLPWSFAVHGTHVATVGIWAGAVPLLLARGLHAGPEALRPLLARFSPLALGLVALGIGAGILSAVLQIGRPAALVATPYGAGLLLKGTLAALALAAAAWLRLAWLRRGGASSPVALLAAETFAIAAILGAAVWLADTPPGRHSEIVWPYDFRIAPSVAWQTPANRTAVLAWAIPAAVLVLAALAVAWRMPRWRWPAVLAALVVGGVGSSQSVRALTVAAYPTTYADSTRAYTADSVLAGRALFAANCTVCHGVTGRGDGPAAAGMVPPPADLSAPHTADHTAGDMVWWITAGYGPMPGFADAIDKRGRWDIVNYLRALAAGWEGRLIGGGIVANRPWLGAVDFRWRDASGAGRRLRDFRGSEVLLVFVRDAASLPRLRALSEAAPALAEAGVVTVAVAPPSVAQGLADLPGLELAVDRGAALFAWSLLRRTLADPDFDDAGAEPPHLEFLIDRFGYVRARWTPADAPPDPTLVATLARLLAAEPEILPPPDEHVH